MTYTMQLSVSKKVNSLDMRIKELLVVRPVRKVYYRLMLNLMLFYIAVFLKSRHTYIQQFCIITSAFSIVVVLSECTTLNFI